MVPEYSKRLMKKSIHETWKRLEESRFYNSVPLSQSCSPVMQTQLSENRCNEFLSKKVKFVFPIY